MILPVNMENVSNMGAQFKTNVFERPARRAMIAGKRLANQKPTPAPTPTGIVSGSHTTNFRTTTAGPRQPAGALPAGSPSKTPAAISSGVTGAPALPPGRSIATPYHQGATPHSMVSAAPALPAGKYRGIATPYTPPARVIPMSGNAALTNRVNPTVAFSDQTSQSPVNRTAFNQPSAEPFKVNQISNPTPAAKPVAPPSQQFSHSESAMSFPQHVPPAGSSTQVLPRLTAAQSTPGRPNTFVVGSRNAKAGGIAAMGSQLEAWAQNRQAEIRASRKA